MDWSSIVIIFTVFVALLLLKKVGQISATDARERLRKGALVIDVRSVGEFGSGHLSTAINIPLDEIETALPRMEKDKDSGLLLHCQSGIRSAIAVKKLKKIGYTNSFNLGSLSRARSIAEGGR